MHWCQASQCLGRSPHGACTVQGFTDMLGLCVHGSHILHITCGQLCAPSDVNRFSNAQPNRLELLPRFAIAGFAAAGGRIAGEDMLRLRKRAVSEAGAATADARPEARLLHEVKWAEDRSISPSSGSCDRRHAQQASEAELRAQRQGQGSVDLLRMHCIGPSATHHLPAAKRIARCGLN